MNDEKKTSEADEAVSQPDEPSADDSSSENEFKLTVRKLELPVRCRGVLAE
jgi:hypothetical protein